MVVRDYRPRHPLDRTVRADRRSRHLADPAAPTGLSCGAGHRAGVPDVRFCGGVALSRSCSLPSCTLHASHKSLTTTSLPNRAAATSLSNRAHPGRSSGGAPGGRLPESRAASPRSNLLAAFLAVCDLTDANCQFRRLSD
jgi:hypothetical protein